MQSITNYMTLALLQDTKISLGFSRRKGTSVSHEEDEQVLLDVTRDSSTQKKKKNHKTTFSALFIS
jgi:hypothetical protein